MGQQAGGSLISSSEGRKLYFCLEINVNIASLRLHERGSMTPSGSLSSGLVGSPSGGQDLGLPSPQEVFRDDTVREGVANSNPGGLNAEFSLHMNHSPNRHTERVKWGERLRKGGRKGETGKAEREGGRKQELRQRELKGRKGGEEDKGERRWGVEEKSGEGERGGGGRKRNVTAL